MAVAISNLTSGSTNATLICDSYSETNSDTTRQFDNNAIVKRGQSFTAAASSYVTRGRIYISKTGSPTGNITLVIYAHTGTYGTTGTPTGSALATSDPIDITTLSTSLALVDFVFSTPLLLTSATKYFVSVEYSGGSLGNALNLGTDSSSPTHGGNTAFFIASWVADATQDHCFYIFFGAATASITPTSNNLVSLTVATRTNVTVDPNQPTAVGNGLTWVVASTTVYDNSSTSRRRETTFRAMGASPSTGVIVIDFGGQDQTDVVWIVDQFSGVDTSGTNGSGAVVQSVPNQDTTGAVNTLTVTLSAFASASNATYGVFANGDGSGTYTVGSGFSQSANVVDPDNNIRSISEFRSDNDTSVDVSNSTNSEIGGIAWEIKASVVAATTKNFALLGVG